MRVKLATTYAGPNGCHAAGAVIDVEAAEGNALVAGGFAIKLDAPPEKRAAAQTRTQQAARAKALAEAEAAVTAAKTAADAAQQAWELAEGEAKGDALVALETARTALAGAEQAVADLKAA